MATLVLFEHNLRLDDNPLVLRARELAQPTLCAALGELPGQPGPYGLVRTGERRQHFLDQCRQELHWALQALGQRLVLIRPPLLSALDRLIRHHGITHILRQRPLASDEGKLSGELSRRHPQVELEHLDGHTLLGLDQLPFALQQLPASYSAFRRAVAAVAVSPPQPAPASLPGPTPEVTPWPHIRHHRDRPFVGGESQGQRQLAHYLDGPAPGHYKETRDQLQGWQSSAKWSPWLAAGCLSARRIWRSLSHYERSWGGNDSTDWLRRELLWREYFQWYACRWGHRLFRFTGIHRRRPPTRFHPGRFTRWCRGSTSFPLVNACMHELNATGYLSNRGRQLVASALVNELQLDWRCGAAYFEQQLIDYDVASNWGNWQYIAGVGADPRGGRHFDLQQQARRFDPGGHYTRRWQGSPPQEGIESQTDRPGGSG
ncbi:DASH family cryptochrome [Ferrimonas sediminicola]|uniref:Cryptochrome DASH n=1 Tax=Ferrimonas sediminicola TaxID=2569538 RepID=A0A4U1BGB3_9GAMM|nr:DASH family cryptochrome [Ferrimonas sediminicola]TKB49051.1 DASH family cryptochrome [Ferrimonas sediminicola]